MKLSRLFNYPEMSIAYPLISRYKYPWEALEHIGEYILEIGKGLDLKEYDKIGEDIWVSKDACVAKSASLNGPLIIERNAEIRHCAYIRGKAIIGKSVVVGNSTEIKNSILFNGVQVPHYNYVGDSILGYKTHLGAGSITSNVKSDKSSISVHIEGQKIDTGLRKMGSIIGDFVEIGCGSVLNPGTVIGHSTQIYPLCSVRGYVDKGSIYKGENNIVVKRDICAE